ncbi:translation elongation factor Ts [Candidatus Palibaumannia cicadellinicola]|nr:translation elongation factor Ts [Candidatus Baumannia cicadellinicola]
MADITTSLVKELRDRTNIGLIKCKKALIEANGDIELAIDNLRKLGQATADKKAKSLANQGLILIKIATNSKYGVIIELNSETDFAVKNKEFIQFGEQVVTTALNKQIINLAVLKEELEQQRIALVDKMGENINISRLGVLKGNIEEDIIVSYLHGTRIGVIVSATTNNVLLSKQLVKNIAMHITAIKPEYVNEDDIPSHVMSREYQIQLNIAMQSNKSDEVTKKIIDGRMRQFIKNISLTHQNFVMDPSITIQQLLYNNKIIVNKFIRFEVGE